MTYVQEEKKKKNLTSVTNPPLLTAEAPRTNPRAGLDLPIRMHAFIDTAVRQAQ